MSALSKWSLVDQVRLVLAHWAARPVPRAPTWPLLFPAGRNWAAVSSTVKGTNEPMPFRIQENDRDPQLCKDLKSELTENKWLLAGVDDLANVVRFSGSGRDGSGTFQLSGVLVISSFEGIHEQLSMRKTDKGAAGTGTFGNVLLRLKKSCAAHSMCAALSLDSVSDANAPTDTAPLQMRRTREIAELGRKFCCEESPANSLIVLGTKSTPTPRRRIRRGNTPTGSNVPPSADAGSVSDPPLDRYLLTFVGLWRFGASELELGANPEALPNADDSQRITAAIRVPDTAPTFSAGLFNKAAAAAAKHIGIGTNYHEPKNASFSPILHSRSTSSSLDSSLSSSTASDARMASSSSISLSASQSSAGSFSPLASAFNPTHVSPETMSPGALVRQLRKNGIDAISSEGKMALVLKFKELQRRIEQDAVMSRESPSLDRNNGGALDRNDGGSHNSASDQRELKYHVHIGNTVGVWIGFANSLEELRHSLAKKFYTKMERELASKFFQNDGGDASQENIDRLARIMELQMQDEGDFVDVDEWKVLTHTESKKLRLSLPRDRSKAEATSISNTPSISDSVAADLERDKILYRYDCTKSPDNQALIFKKKIGEGQFGEVWRGKWLRDTKVAIKILKGEVASCVALEIKEEASMLRNNLHDNILALMGVYLDSFGRLSLVTSWCSLGSLLDVLRRPTNPHDGGSSLPVWSAVFLLGIARQIASGMNHLHFRSVIHRDLAARNVLCRRLNRSDSGVIAQIADLGLARSLGDHYDQYAVGNSIRPIRWTAPEALRQNGAFTLFSDVWSFGILLHEMWTGGDEPYYSIQSTQMLIEHVCGGNKLACPPGCDQEVYSLMEDCWKMSASERPRFQVILRRLKALEKLHTSAVSQKLMQSRQTVRDVLLEDSADCGNYCSDDELTANQTTIHHPQETSLPHSTDCGDYITDDDLEVGSQMAELLVNQTTIQSSGEKLLADNSTGGDNSSTDDEEVSSLMAELIVN